jgi:uncharacterized coiled-coil DUF342 family protein
MEILNGVYFSNEEFAELNEHAESDDALINELRALNNELNKVIKSVRADRNAWRDEYEAIAVDLRDTRLDIVNLVKGRDALREELDLTKAKLEVAITLGTLFMVAAAKE